MQERYLGDSHDFLKYALLRHLKQSLNVRIGVNWYLTDPELVDKPGNNDGEKRHHLKQSDWRKIDPDLFEVIQRFEVPAFRKLENIAAWNILPNDTAYYETPVPVLDRAKWQQQSHQVLENSDLIFLDPDNGLEVKSMTVRTAPKYALFREAADYVRAGKTVISIQFARQCDPVMKGKEIRKHLVEECHASDHLPIIRGRLAPNILFLAVAQSDRVGPLSTSLVDFAARCQKAEIIP